MKRLLIIAAVCVAATGANAQSEPKFDEVKITRWGPSRSGNYTDIVIQGTTKDQWILCATFDADGNAINSDEILTDNLVTTGSVPAVDGQEVASVQCVEN